MTAARPAVIYIARTTIINGAMLGKISDIMTRNVVTLKKGDNVMAAVKLMTENSISCVVITDVSSKPVGIVTERDMVKRVLNNSVDPHTTKIETIMTSPVMTVSSHKRVTQAIEIMQKYRFRRLVIVSDDSKLEGILTQSNLMLKVHKTQIELEKMNESLRKSLDSIRRYSKVGTKDARVKSLKEKVRKLESKLEKTGKPAKA